MIESDLLNKVVSLVKSKGLSEALVTEFRHEFPGVHFTWCIDDDMGSARPTLEEAGFNLYLVDSTDHCARLTNDPERASGIILAELVDEDSEEDIKKD